jgi:hypothetical protein
MLQTRALRTSWWKCFVDGTNPEDQGRQLVSQFFRQHRIDPYKLEHATINDYKRFLLLEVQDPIGVKKGKGGPKSVKLAMERLAELRRFEIMRFQREFPLANFSDLDSKSVKNS